MSLAERVRRAGNDTDHASPQRFQELERLRAAVYERLPASDIARMAEHNPQLARSEIRTVCDQVFKGDAWSMRSAAERAELVEELLDSVFGFGPLEGLLADDRVTEIMVNGTSSVYYEVGGVLFRAGYRFSSDAQVRALIDRIISPLGRRIDESSPSVDARLPQGFRVHAIIPPIAIDGPALTIRKFPSHTLRLCDMETSGSVEPEVARLLAWAVRARRNVAVTGGTGTGKTTILNALSCEIPAQERIVTIEDSAELRFSEHPHVVRLEARPRNAEGVGEMTIRMLVVNALRMRPDRIVVGECRGGEALDMLQAMATGHDGSLTTLHANSPEDAVGRLAMMVRYAADLPIDAIGSAIASALDLIVQVSRSPDGRRYVSRMAEVERGPSGEGCRTKVVYARPLPDDQGRWTALPRWVGELTRLGIERTEEVAAWQQRISLPS